MPRRTLGGFLVSSLVAVSVAAWASAAGAQQGNLLTNGRFDTTTSPWPSGQSDYSTLLYDGFYDADFCDNSGVAKVTLDSSIDFGSTFLGVCRSGLTGGAEYQISAAMRYLTTAVDGVAHVQVSFYDGSGCTGNSVSASGFKAGTALSSVTGWQRFTHIQAAPVGAVSAMIYIYVRQDESSQAPIVVRFDEIFFARSTYVFSDNFEVESVCRWSN